MAQSNLLPGFTSSLGDELNRLAGQRLTRLTATIRAEEVIQGGINNLSTSGGGPPYLTVALTAAVWVGDVVSGLRLRILSGVQAGLTRVINVVATTSTLTVTVGFDAALSSVSWEIVRDADTTATVESTSGMLAVGRVFIAEVLYAYVGKTSTTLTGLSHFDGASAWVTGAKREHDPLEEVLDANKALSAVDQAWRQMFIRTADGEGLSILGASKGVPRPPELEDDAIYAALIEAVAFSPRGTKLVVAAALEAVFGAAGYELFEEPTTRLGKLYVRRVPELRSSTDGKAFIADRELYRSATLSTVVVDAPDPLRVVGVRLANDTAERVVQLSEIVGSATYNPGTGLTTITLSLAVFSANIKPGDVFTLLRGTQTRAESCLRGTVVQRVSARVITLGHIEGTPTPTAIPKAFVAASWQITRPLTNCRLYKPSADTALEFPADAGTQAWTYVGPDETNDAIVTSDATGKFLQLYHAATETAAYSRLARIDLTAFAEIELQVRVSGLTNGASDGHQAMVSIRDGNKTISIGFIRSGANAIIGFLNGSAQHLGTTYDTGVEATWMHLRLVKNGEDRVELYVNGVLRLTATYASMPAATAYDWRFGCIDTASTVATLMQIKQVAWRSECLTNLWDVTERAGTTGAPDLVNSTTLTFVVGDVGKRVRVETNTARNGSGGNAKGSWEISARVSGSQVQVVGPQRNRLAFLANRPGVVEIRGRDDALRYPDRLGYHVLIAAHAAPGGEHAGDWAIDQLLDGADRDLHTLAPPSLAAGLTGTLGVGAPYPEESTSFASLFGAPAAWTDRLEADWRLVPLFPADAGPIRFVLEDRGTQAGQTLTLGTALPAALSTAVLAVDLVRVRSATLTESIDHVEIGGVLGPTTHYPFGLFDHFGWVRRFLASLMPATFQLRYDELYRDELDLLHIADTEG